MTTLLMVSSGKTEAEDPPDWIGFKIAGQLDWPLTQMGKWSAMALTSQFRNMSDKPVAVYSGPLKRDRQTAEHVGYGVGRKPVIVPELIGPDLGEIEGLSFFDVRARYPVLTSKISKGFPLDTQFPGGEVVGDFYARVRKALDVIATRWHPGETVAIVCHNWIIHAAMAHYTENGYEKPPSL
jgi:broad specificity phosphatase PhoE